MASSTVSRHSSRLWQAAAQVCCRTEILIKSWLLPCFATKKPALTVSTRKIKRSKVCYLTIFSKWDLTTASLWSIVKDFKMPWQTIKVLPYLFYQPQFKKSENRAFMLGNISCTHNVSKSTMASSMVRRHSSRLWQAAAQVCCRTEILIKSRLLPCFAT